MESTMNGSAAQQRRLMYYLRFSDPESCESYLSDLAEHRQRSKPACAHCDSHQVIGHGRYKQRQRYKCKDCGRTFNDFTNTPLHRTHYPHKWIKFIQCVLEGHSLRRCAIRVGVSWVTLFYWRHKIIHVLPLLEQQFPLIDIPYKKRHRPTTPHLFLTNDLATTPQPTTSPQPTTTYLMVRYRKNFPTIPFPLQEEFIEWIQSFDRIAHKYWKRYVAWYYYVFRTHGASGVGAIQTLLRYTSSIRLNQTYESVRLSTHAAT